MAKDCGQPWFKEAKFGMFIHWGIYSHLGGLWKGKQTPHIGEFMLKHMDIEPSEYEATASEFNPVDFDADQIVRLAKEAGMKYLVFTAKHHDGFAMYHSKCSSYNIVDATPYKKDPMKDLSIACNKYGIKFCFYYSQTQDWHHPDGYDGYIWRDKPDDKRNFRKYLDEKCLPQLRELLTEYGDIGLIWFDTPLTMAPQYSKEIYDFVKKIQPNVIVNGRIGNRYGEYVNTGDNYIPTLPFHSDWEVPATLNHSWGYRSFDHDWKSAEEVLKLLVKINSKGGNYLLNVGPDGRGRIPQASIDVLNTIGKWMGKNGESIYATQAAPIFPYEYGWGMFTYKPNRLYMHVFKRDTLHYSGVQSIGNKITRAYFLATGKDIPYKQGYDPAQRRNRLNFSLHDSDAAGMDSGVLTDDFDDIDTVICLEFEGDSLIFDSLDDL
jgi:alpha-L-fucosidase